MDASRAPLKAPLPLPKEVVRVAVPGVRAGAGAL
jgi:hypothetical protein